MTATRLKRISKFTRVRALSHGSSELRRPRAPQGHHLSGTTLISTELLVARADRRRRFVRGRPRASECLRDRSDAFNRRTSSTKACSKKSDALTGSAREGKPANHQLAKELFAGFVGAEVDKLVETKGLDEWDREKIKREARRHGEEQIQQQY